MGFKNRVSRRDTSEAQALYEAAFAAMSRDEPAAAVPLYEQAMDAAPKRARIRSNYAVALVSLDRSKEAHEQALRAVDLADDDDAYPLAITATTLHAIGDYDGVLRVVHSVLCHPNCGDILRARMLSDQCWALLQLERDREAVACANELVACAPDAPEHHSLLASCLGSMRRFGEALEALGHAERLAPTDTDIIEKKYTLQSGLTIVEDALNELTAAPNEGDWKYWHEVGYLRALLGRLEQAAEAFDRAHALHPDAPSQHGGMLSTVEADCRLALIRRAQSADNS